MSDQDPSDFKGSSPKQEPSTKISNIISADNTRLDVARQYRKLEKRLSEAKDLPEYTYKSIDILSSWAQSSKAPLEEIGKAWAGFRECIELTEGKRKDGEGKTDLKTLKSQIEGVVLAPNSKCPDWVAEDEELLPVTKGLLDILWKSLEGKNGKSKGGGSSGKSESDGGSHEVDSKILSKVLWPSVESMLYFAEQSDNQFEDRKKGMALTGATATKKSDQSDLSNRLTEVQSKYQSAEQKVKELRTENRELQTKLDRSREIQKSGGGSSTQKPGSDGPTKKSESDDSEGDDDGKED